MAHRIKDAKDTMIERVTCEDVVNEDQDAELLEEQPVEDEHDHYDCEVYAAYGHCKDCQEYWRDEMADIATRGGY